MARFQLSNTITINLVMIVIYLFSSLLFIDRTTYAQHNENLNPINITKDMIDLLTNIGQQENESLSTITKDESKNNKLIDIDEKNNSDLLNNLSQILNVQNLLLQKLEQIHQQQQQQQQQINETTYPNKDLFIKESESIFLGDIELAEGDLMHIYQVNPFTVSNATILSKLPCDENNLTPVDILAGKLPDFQNIPLDYIVEFSDPGNLCNYKTEIVKFNSSIPFSELAIFNNSTEDIEFPSSSAIHVGITTLNKNNAK